MKHTEIQESIIKEPIPQHIGIIMDGNGRWAKKRFLPRISGHKEGVKRIEDILEESRDLGVKYLSLYAFSTENWKRPLDEVTGLMNLIVHYVNTSLDIFHRNNVKLQTLGNINKLPDEARNAVERAKVLTQDNDGIILNIGLNYGSRDEIIGGIKKFILDNENTPGLIDKLDGEFFNNYLDTKGQPDLDLLIRPGGEKRVSNFMLYQLAYSELYFTDCLWPDFTKAEYQKAIIEFQNRERRYGGLK